MKRVKLLKTLGRTAMMLAVLVSPAYGQEPQHGTVEVLYSNIDGSFRSPVHRDLQF